MLKNYSATTRFLIGIIFGISILLDNASAKDCQRSTSMALPSSNPHVAKVVLQTCFISDSRGYIEAQVMFKERHKQQRIRVSFEGAAFLPEIDESNDFNNDGVKDLGIANGRGRSGDGFDYWLYDPASLKYSRLGEYARLVVDKSQTGIFFNLVSGGDRYYVRRYNFIFKSAKLKTHSTYGFSPCQDQKDCTELVMLEPHGAGVPNRRLSAIDVERCMAGTGACF